MRQDVNVARKIAVEIVGCVFAYFCGGHKNNFPISFRSSFKVRLSHLPRKFSFIYVNDSPSEMMKNAFYFIIKALFVLKIYTFLSLPFGHVEKTAGLERQD